MLTNMKPFISNIEEDLERPHKVTLTEGQIATILYILEGAIQGNDEYNEEDQFQMQLSQRFDELPRHLVVKLRFSC